MDIILSTTNPSKAEQIQAMFDGLPITILTLKAAGITGEAVEDGTTLAENAMKKAMFAHQRALVATWTMADDTGLFIEALNGEPGIRAARWAGDQATTEEITQYTLDRLEGIKNRAARIETAVALVSPEGEVHYFVGKVNGQLLTAPRIPSQPKMPYSSLFVPEGQDKVWAEMTVAEENLISQRGQAFAQVRDFLAKI